MGNSELGIDSLDIGIYQGGMAEYKEKLKTELLTTVQSKINNVTEIETAINNGWQGQSRDIFLKDFQEIREKINNELLKEYQDLEQFLDEIEGAYFSIDRDIMSDIK